MSRPLNITDEIANELCEDFKNLIHDTKYIENGKISFTKTFVFKEKATLYFTELAYLKMKMLVESSSKEVAWHGLVKRHQQEANAFVVYDILIYPQKVTGVTVETDQEEYQNWLMGHDDDTFNNIRLQGHSHVYMNTTPSSVDRDLYEGIVSQLTGDMFYIFIILNKKGEKFIQIYDFMSNLVFDTEDVFMEVIDDNTGVKRFIEDAKGMIKAESNTYIGYKYGQKSSYSRRKLK